MTPFSLTLPFLTLACILMAMFFNLVGATRGARVSTHLIGIAGLCNFALLIMTVFFDSSGESFILGVSINTLNLLLSQLVLFVSFIVHRFSLRYMAGDRLFKRFYLLLDFLTGCSYLMVLSDNLFLFWATWSLSNLCLVGLMMHKTEWFASKQSGLLAIKFFGVGSIFLLTAFVYLAFDYSSQSIEMIVREAGQGKLPESLMPMILIFITAFIQCGLFPFHSWLLSSLNSPTPVSALMHAGLVNGGGILIVKFSSFMLAYPYSLTLVFIAASLSVILGTIWKLMQNDIKRMLACSTMAQMGFMIMQCTLGLFVAAIAHLCWHGLFKAYSFLSSGSAVKQKQMMQASNLKINSLSLMISVLGGIASMMLFSFITHKPFSFTDANTFILFFSFICGAEVMHEWVRSHMNLFGVLMGILIAVFAGAVYGGSVQLVQLILPNLLLMQTQSLETVHWVVMILLGLLWVLFTLRVYDLFFETKWGCKIYLSLFNASQPAKKTITAIRQDYRY